MAKKQEARITIIQYIYDNNIQMDGLLDQAAQQDALRDPVKNQINRHDQVAGIWSARTQARRSHEGTSQFA